MKKTILIFFALVALSLGKTPVQLAKDGACFWPANKTDEETEEVVIKKGCPQYYSEKADGCSVKFSTKRITEDDEVFEILIADWNTTEITVDGKTKLKGTTKFVVDTRDGEEGLFPFEITVGCKGQACKLSEKTMTSMMSEIASIFGIYDLSGMGGIWNRTFSIDKEAAKYYVNHNVMQETVNTLMMQALLSDGQKVTLAEMDPVYFISVMSLSEKECPSLKNE
mgnify:FL=1